MKNIIVLSLIGAGALYIIWKFYARHLLNKHHLEHLKRSLVVYIAEATGELQALQALAKNFDVGETVHNISIQLNDLIKEIGGSSLQKINEIENFNNQCIEITNKLIDLCDEPERYFKKIAAEEG